jgi:hypothetical protein
MEKVRKYRLVLKQTDGIYIRYAIDGLKMAFYKNYDSKLETFGGGCGLVRNSRFPGYCNLCMTFHSKASNHFENGYTVEFSPLFNKDGEMILIRHNSDELYAYADRGYMDYDTREFVDCELTMWRHGLFEGFRL